LANFLALKMESVRSSKTSVNFHQNTWCQIQEDSTLVKISVVLWESEWRKKLVNMKWLHLKIILVTRSNKNWVMSLNTIFFIQWYNEILTSTRFLFWKQHSVTKCSFL
jgi:hypothetical protein